MKQVWMANDGKTFDCVSECAKYESNLYFSNLLALITHNVGMEYNDEIGCEEITAHTVAKFIEDYIYSIAEILRDGGKFD